MSTFMQGLDLSQLFFEEIVRPRLDRHFPGLPYAAALIGWGSEVLGYDDPQSTDHNWGPRLQLFIAEPAFAQLRQPLLEMLDRGLPADYRGFPTRFPVITADVAGLTGHQVEVTTLREYFRSYLGCDPLAELAVADWLTFPEHRLLALISGRVFHDGQGELHAVRQKLAYYPREVWIYMLAAQWARIFEEQAFVGRCGFVGDELGSRLIAARQVKNLMRLGFLIERRYAPYSKWFGTAFGQLDCAAELSPLLIQVTEAADWQTRQAALAQAYAALTRRHNALGLTVPLEEAAAPYHDRPYLVVGDGRQVEELRKALTSEELKAQRHLLGSVSQWIDASDQLEYDALRQELRGLYAPPPNPPGSL